MRRVTTFRIGLLAGFAMLLVHSVSFGQACVNEVRQYASLTAFNKNGIGTNIINPYNTIDGNPNSSSTLSRLLVGSVTQFLNFSQPVAAGKALSVKVSIPSSLIGLLSGVEIQPYTNLHAIGAVFFADPAGKTFSDSDLGNLINGSGEMEITVIPQESDGTAVAYDGVWIKLSGLAINQSLNLFHAYYKSAEADPIACGSPVDVLAGVRAGTVIGGILNASGTVNNPLNAIDNDPAFTTYATLDVNLAVLSEVYHTTIFNTISQPGDLVNLILQRPGGGTLNLNNISGLTFQLYNGPTPVGAPVTSGSGWLALTQISAAAGDEKYKLTITPPFTDGAYDRVEVKIGGFSSPGLIQSLRIYDVSTTLPIIEPAIAGSAVSSLSICEGATATLSVNNVQSCTTYKWFDAATGGNLLETGTSYTPSASSLSTSSPNNFYVEPSRTGCTETTSRTLVTLTVKPSPVVTVGTNPSVCTGITSALLPYTASHTPVTYSITWSPAAISAGFADVTDQVLPASNITLNAPSAAAPAIYTGTVRVKNSDDCSSSALPFNLTIIPKPTQPTIIINN